MEKLLSVSVGCLLVCLIALPLGCKPSKLDVTGIWSLSEVKGLDEGEQSLLRGKWTITLKPDGSYVQLAQKVNSEEQSRVFDKGSYALEGSSIVLSGDGSTKIDGKAILREGQFDEDFDSFTISDRQLQYVFRKSPQAK